MCELGDNWLVATIIGEVETIKYKVATITILLIKKE
jgi:hypothetical protein